MNKEIIVIAPHPDDETLGCGGTILRHIAEGDRVHWVIVTCIKTEYGFSDEKVNSRDREVNLVAARYGFDSIHRMELPTTRLDTISMGDIVKGLSDIFCEVSPEIIYLPYGGDIHTDHKVVFNAVASCTKWFRYSSIKRVLAYETLSETDFAINPDDQGFKPNVFVNIGEYLEKKIEIMGLYKGEMGEFPFPRSEDAIRALAAIRGVAGGFTNAEAFILLKETL